MKKMMVAALVVISLVAMANVAFAERGNIGGLPEGVSTKRLLLDK